MMMMMIPDEDLFLCRFVCGLLYLLLKLTVFDKHGFFFATVQLGPRPPHRTVLDHTLRHASDSDRGTSAVLLRLH
jgi:hypothetical protein